jgi:hypothetical protein
MARITRRTLFIRKCVAPIRDLIVPNGCSTVVRRGLRRQAGSPRPRRDDLEPSRCVRPGHLDCAGRRL